MPSRTPHLANLEKCNCNTKDSIDKSKFKSISTFQGLTASQILANRVRMNKTITQYVYTHRDTSTTIVPPRNKF